jgi:hypothetical protein
MGKFLYRWLIVFVVMNGLDFLVHGMLLKNDYASIPQLMRAEADAQKHTIYLIVAFAFMAAAMVWIYGRGIQNRPWLGQGLRFGLAMWVLISIPIFLIYFAVQPIPPMLVCKQILFELPMMLLIGITVGAVHKGQSSPQVLSASAR